MTSHADGVPSHELGVSFASPGWRRQLPTAETLVRQAVAAALATSPPPRPVEIGLLLTHDNQVQGLNRQFRHQDKPTNVLAFAETAAMSSSLPDDQAVPLGDIAVAYGVCAREARQQGKTLADHLNHLVVHGVLHLLGFDHQDETQAQRMEQAEVAILANLGIDNPYRSRSCAETTSDEH